MLNAGIIKRQLKDLNGQIQFHSADAKECCGRGNGYAQGHSENIRCGDIENKINDNSVAIYDKRNFGSPNEKQKNYGFGDNVCGYYVDYFSKKNLAFETDEIAGTFYKGTLC